MIDQICNTHNKEHPSRSLLGEHAGQLPKLEPLTQTLTSEVAIVDFQFWFAMSD